MQNRRSLPPLEDDFTRALLRSAEVDEPSSAAYAKVAAALGVGTALGVGASLPAPAAVVAGASGASALARWSGTLAGKLALLGVSGTLLLGAGAAFLLHRGASKPVAARNGSSLTSTPLPAAEPRVATKSALAAAQPAAAAEPPVALADAASASTGHDAPHSSVRPAHAAFHGLRSSSSSLPEQVQSLDRARVALNSGDAGAALIEIAHYRKAWPKGVFLTEASVLEIEALAKRGERSLAATRAQSFVAAHPDSPQAERLRALIPAAQP
ncbi:MAG TPA: hypothetical protein VHW01_14895 [Polyangiaceae bacterium]|jgi:hypothetical protein|nr:hypothetical protein [Polyangiaceae bacterium]